MKSIEEIATILGDIVDRDYCLGHSRWNSKEPRFIEVDGGLDLFRIIEELQAAGLITVRGNK